MSPNAQRLLEEARQLAPDEREWLAESLLIAERSEAEVASAWDAEIKRRLDEIDSGAVKMISHEEFVANLDAHIASKRKFVSDKKEERQTQILRLPPPN